MRHNKPKQAKKKPNPKSIVNFERLIIEWRGSGKKRRPDIRGVFRDQNALGITLEYNAKATENAIKHRRNVGNEVAGLEAGLLAIQDKMTELNGQC